MALSWMGSTVTPMIQAMPALNGKVVMLAIVNTFRSRVNVNILRTVCQADNAEAPTGNTAGRVMPIIRTRRCPSTSISGGVEVKARPAWDTTLNAPDAGVKVLFDPGAFGGPDTAIVAVTGISDPFWQQFTMRRASDAEQVLTWDNFCVPAMAESKALILKPGEAFIFEQQDALPTGGSVFFDIAWEEDTVDAGYVVGGTVNLSGSPVSGAKVLLVTDSATSMPAPTVEVLTTGAPGTFSKTVASGVKAAVFVQHENGGTKYTDEGNPYIEKA